MKNADLRKWWILFSLTFGILAVSLDMTILNVALPTLAADLVASTGQLQWFANSYNLVLAAALLPAGLLGDRYGRKKMLLFALALFGAASVGCAVADSSDMLIVMRAFLGLGSAFLIPLSMSILPVLFEGAERAKAMTLWAMANMLGIPLGPIVGGWLLKHYEWGSVFYINLPLVAIALFAVSALMPESRSSERPRIDLFGIVCSSVGLTALSFGIIRGGEEGWGDTTSIFTIVAGALGLALFAIWQRRSKHPLIDLSLFRMPGFTWGAILATLVSCAMFGLLFVLPQFFQAISGSDSLDTGLRLLPLIGGLIVGAKIADALNKKIGLKVTAAIGFAFLSAGLAIGAATDTGSGYGFVVIWVIIAGLGLGLALPTAMSAALDVLTAERSGVGSALIMALRQVGGVIGVALLGAALNDAYIRGLNLDGLPGDIASKIERSVTSGIAVATKLNANDLLNNVRHSFVNGMSSLLWICGGIALLGAILALAFLPRRMSSSSNSDIAL
ncbi:DHA2 family efflux MFS transporter permease subunit [Cohnella soli]|uniref:DHA2 family efflux MFS transporter permease subunit n=1 Tax=Cohnella soli TaxID=425005 RepID=A0ABW0HWY0_9BACL